jgi:hypothetical protein
MVRAGKYIMFKGEGETKEEKLYLEDRPIAFQRAIVSTPTFPAPRRLRAKTSLYVITLWPPNLHHTTAMSLSPVVGTYHSSNCRCVKCL